MKKFILCSSFMLFGCFCFAQQYDELTNHVRTADTTTYYLNLNSSFSDLQQVAFKGGKIGVIFDDKFGINDSIRLEVVNLSFLDSSSYVFKKTYGVNKFILESLDFSKYDSLVVLNLSAKDDLGKTHQKNLLVDPKKDILPISISIIKSPLQINCQNPELTKIEYFSDVKGGKAPYLVEWNFSGNEKGLTEFLPIQGYSSAIMVDLPPPYYIGLKVTDSCGEVEFQTLQVICDATSTNYNTILFTIDPAKKRFIEK